MFKRLRRRRAARHPAQSERARLEVCTSCDADYVHPVEWSESGEEHWWMLLRCGECGTEREVTVANPIAQRFGDTLDEAERDIRRVVARLDAERMASEVEMFAAALERDLIDPADFCR
jgi:uncharacterized Zn finger protein